MLTGVLASATRVASPAEVSGAAKAAVQEAAQEAFNRLNQKWQDLQAKVAPITDEAKSDLQNTRDQIACTLATSDTERVEAKDAGEEQTGIFRSRRSLRSGYDCRANYDKTIQRNTMP